MKFKTEWDLTHIYKSNPKKSLEKDVALLKRIYGSFARKYRKDKKHLRDPKALKKALEEFEKLSKNPAATRPGYFFEYKTHLNSEDNDARAEIAKLQDIFSDLSTQVEFFMLEIAKVPKNVQTKFLKSKELKEFHYLLNKLFENAKHYLTEPEEKIMTLKSLPSHSMWVSGFEKLVSKQSVKFQKKEVPLAEAMAKIPTLRTKERRSLHKESMQVLKNIADFAESEINAVVTNKKIGDRLRGFKLPYEATVKGYENELKTVNELVSAVTNNFGIAHKFFAIKAEMIKEKRLAYADRAARAGEVNIKIPFEEAARKTIETFNKAGKEFGSFVEEMLEKGLVDVYPKKGKHGGAYCSSGTGIPTYVLLNHIPDFRSMTVLAHEMGHALHSKFSKKQRPIYEDYTTAVAEVASTFFETLVFEEALENVNESERMILLHDKITDDISTIFRQIACFNFENELHLSIRKEGFLSKEKIADLMNKHMQSYLGPLFDFDQIDGYFFVQWSHIRVFFYVYSYAFGQLISHALYERYKKDNSKIKDVVEFLSAGGSDSPENIFKKIGINPNKKFFESGLNKIKSDIEELERLWKKSLTK